MVNNVAFVNNITISVYIATLALVLACFDKVFQHLGVLSFTTLLNILYIAFMYNGGKKLLFTITKNSLAKNMDFIYNSRTLKCQGSNCCAILKYLCTYTYTNSQTNVQTPNCLNICLGIQILFWPKICMHLAYSVTHLTFN